MRATSFGDVPLLTIDDRLLHIIIIYYIALINLLGFRVALNFIPIPLFSLLTFFVQIGSAYRNLTISQEIEKKHPALHKVRRWWLETFGHFSLLEKCMSKIFFNYRLRDFTCESKPHRVQTQELQRLPDKTHLFDQKPTVC